jgi:large subunit ribosomal protein L25
MSDSVTLVTEKREGHGSRLASKLRKRGKVPAVVYGLKQDTLSVSIDHDPLLHAIQHNIRVVDLKLDGHLEKAQIKEVQWDYLGKDIVHVDFKRIRPDERIKVQVRIEVRGIAPGVGEGGVLDQPLHVLDVECPALAVPDSIRVNIHDLHLGNAIHVRDLKFPEGVKCLADPDAIVIHVTSRQAEEAASPEASGPAEPEVITRKKTEEGEEE